MKTEDKVLAEAILRHLCIGCRICGITFYAVPILLIDVVDEPQPSTDIQLTIEGEWYVFDEFPVQLPVFEPSDRVVDKRRTAELICAIGELGWHHIIDVRLGESSPHLILTFDNEQILYINGHHDRFESWNISAGEFMVVATPGDKVAIWCPEDFLTKHV